MNEPEISVVVPVYRSEGTLPTLVERVDTAMRERGFSYEIVLVDDCSPDGSWEKITELGATNPRVRGFQLLKNVGQQWAVVAGFEQARGRFIVTMDDDLQHRPEEIGLLYDALMESGDDVIIGRYATGKRHSTIRRTGTRVVGTIARRLIGIPGDLEFTSFRIVRRSVAQAITSLRPFTPVVGYMLASVTTRISNVDVTHSERAQGESNYSFANLAKYLVAMLVDYSHLPLRLVSGTGALIAVASGILGIGYFVAYLLGLIGAAGFASIVLLILFLSGAIVASIGIIGVYLLRIIHNLVHPNDWILRQSSSAASESGGQLKDGVEEL